MRTTLVIAACLLGAGASVALIRAAYLAIDRRFFGRRATSAPARSDSPSAPRRETRKSDEEMRDAQADVLYAHHAQLRCALRGDRDGVRMSRALAQAAAARVLSIADDREREERAR